MGTFWMRAWRVFAIVGLGELAVHLASYLHLGLTGILIGILAYVATSSVKAKTVEGRVGAVVAAQGTTNANVTTQTNRVNNLSGQSTGTGLPAGTPTGGPNGNFTSTSSSYPTGQTSSALSGANAHTHDYGGHYHDMQSHTHDFDGHTHDLPTV